MDQPKLTEDQTGVLRGASESGFGPKVAIIVLHYGDPNDTMECLRSIVELQYENVFAVILDNGTINKYSILNHKNAISNLAVAKNWKFEDLSTPLAELSIKGEPRTLYLLRTEENRLWTGGNNYCIKLIMPTNPDWIWLLNNDTVFSSETLKKIMENVTSKEVDLISPYVYIYSNPNQLNLPGGTYFIPWFPRYWFIQGFNLFLSKRRIKHVVGPSMFVKAEVFNKVGLFDPNLHYYEDYAFSLRARKKGFKIGSCNNAKVLHKMGAATKTSFSENRKNLLFFRDLFVTYIRLNKSLLWYFLLTFLFFCPLK